MPLATGDKLGPYEILSPLGAGGMGEVYKARDTRLDRSVAVKVLPEHIAKREDLRARFEREARAVASLNHPNICTLFDIGVQDGTSYMVMELMEGETLAARIEKGPILLEQAVSYATQIADALDRAHRAGVTHRDVKPANIMLTRDGVKVLDFGLAKSAAPTIGPNDATIVQGLTTEGVVLGTPQYMAPEQFEGREADARADIWAFGAVLYEMVTGQKAFQGKSYSTLVGAILAADPPPMAVKPFTPSWLERLVRRCLAKEPEDRYHCMRDLVLDLRTPPLEALAVAAKPNRWKWATAACAAIAIAVALFPLRKTGEPPVQSKYDITPPPATSFANTVNVGGTAISPDGTTLAFVATSAKGESLLYLRKIDSLEARALPGTENAGRPFWSPDSKSIGFGAGGKLKRIDVVGGVPLILCDAPVARGGTWNQDGVILYADRSVGLNRIPASGGTPVPVTKIDAAKGELYHYYPQFLPGGKEFLFMVRSNDAARAGIYWGSLDGRVPVQILATSFNGLYDANSARLLYVQGEGTLMARKLELNPPRLSGDPAMVAQGLSGVRTNGYAEFSISGNGTLFHGRGSLGLKQRFAWFDRTGKQLETIGQPFEATNPFIHLSADGSRVAYSAGTPSDIWVMPVASGIATRVSFSGGSRPRWSPDGTQIYYSNGGSICRRASDGSGGEELLAKERPDTVLFSVSPDGKHLLFGFSDILRLSLERGQKPEPYLQTKFTESNGAFSPDGRWVAYNSDESGRSEIYIQGFPERLGKWQISAEGGFLPQWRADGKELYWLGNDLRSVMAAPVELQAEAVKSGRPELLFRTPIPGFATLDGKRFLVQIPEGGEQQALPMAVVTNWAAGLAK